MREGVAVLKFKSALADIPPECKGNRSRTLGCPVVFRAECERVTLIDMDCAAASKRCRMLGVNDTRCDYLVFGRDTGRKLDFIAVIEAKSGKPSASKVIAQIRAGTEHVTRLVCHVGDFIFYPVVVYGGSMSKVDRGRLGRMTTSLFGKKRGIRVVSREALLPPRESDA